MANNLSERSLFLHFVNREIHYIKASTLNEADHISLMKCAGLMTCGCLVAPFAQVTELYARKKNINALIDRLAKSGKLVLYNGAIDFPTFLEGRQELYAQRRDKYPVYFDTKSKNKALYSMSSVLNTTKFIRKTLVEAVTPGIPSPNILSGEESARLRLHKDFIVTKFAEEKYAATYSLFEMQDIGPKPQEVRFFGEISSRLFANHYADSHDLIIPTGVYCDPQIETYDKYPFFDMTLQRFLLSRLGLTQMICDESFHDPYVNLIADPHLPFFCEKREELFRVIAFIANVDLINPRKSELAILPLLQTLDFEAVNTIGPLTANRLAQTIDDALKISYRRDRRFAAAREALRIMIRQRATVLLLTATPLEDSTFRAQAAVNGYQPTVPQTFKEFTATLYRKGDGAELWHVRTSAGSAGVGGSARIADLAIRQLSPVFVFAVGIAFGLYDNKQRAGDVLVAESVFPYERGRMENGIFKRRGEILACAPETVSFASQYDLIDPSFKVIPGPIFSGEKLVDDPNFTKFLRELDEKAVGGEMEAAGIVQACQVLGVRFSLIKGIADFGQSKGDKDQSRAAQNAFKFFFEMFKRFDASGTFSPREAGQ